MLTSLRSSLSVAVAGWGSVKVESSASHPPRAASSSLSASGRLQISEEHIWLRAADLLLSLSSMLALGGSVTEGWRRWRGPWRTWLPTRWICDCGECHPPSGQSSGCHGTSLWTGMLRDRLRTFSFARCSARQSLSMDPARKRRFWFWGRASRPIAELVLVWPVGSDKDYQFDRCEGISGNTSTCLWTARNHLGKAKWKVWKFSDPSKVKGRTSLTHLVCGSLQIYRVGRLR